MNLPDLLKTAGIPSHYAALWFDGCALEASTLYVPDKPTGERLARLYGPQLREALPSLHIRVGVPLSQRASATPQPPGFLNAAGRKAWHGQRKEAAQQRLQEQE